VEALLLRQAVRWGARLEARSETRAGWPSRPPEEAQRPDAAPMLRAMQVVRRVRASPVEVQPRALRQLAPVPLNARVQPLPCVA
jgi:hypothetical protein